MLDSHGVQLHSCVESDHEYFLQSVILSHQLIQEEQLCQFVAKECAQVLVNCLEGCLD